jgi:membrane protein insertase Oxa1/YidC/SpoIIIJ
MPDPTPNTTPSASSLFSKIWKWALGGLLALIAVFVIWKMRSQAKKITKLEVDNVALKCQLDELVLTQKEAQSQAKSQELAGQIVALQSVIAERDKKLAALREAYAKNKQDIGKIKTWDDIP